MFKGINFLNLRHMPLILGILWFAFLVFYYPLSRPFKIISIIVFIIYVVWGLLHLYDTFYFEVKNGKFIIKRRPLQELYVLNRVLQMMNEERSLEEVLRGIMDEAYQLVPTAQTSCFVVYNPKSGMYEFKEVRSQSLEFFENLLLTVDEVENRFKDKTGPFIENHVRKSDKNLQMKNREQFQKYGVPEAILFIPIRMEGQLKGYITLDNWTNRNAFSKKDILQIEKIQPQLILAYSRAERNAELAQYKHKLEKLFCAGQELAVIDDPDELVKRALTLIRSILLYKNICVFLIEKNELVFKGGYKSDVEDKYFTQEFSMDLQKGVCGWVARHGEVRVVADVKKDPLYVEISERIGSEIAVPLKVGNEVLGVLNVESVRPNSFQHEDEELLMTVASQLGIALSNLRHKNALRKALLQMITALARSIETKDCVTGGHCERMEDYAIRVGEALRLLPKRLENLRRAAILHDIGKIGIPGYILEKPGKLTFEEFKIMQEHPTFGANILREVDFLKEVADIVEQHHERIDGRGYPKKLKGEEICLEARIITVVDAYDAMTSDRPYRQALPKNVAIEELKKHSGTQFDVAVVDAFIKTLPVREIKLTS